MRWSPNAAKNKQNWKKAAVIQNFSFRGRIFKQKSFFFFFLSKACVWKPAIDEGWIWVGSGCGDPLSTRLQSKPWKPSGTQEKRGPPQSTSVKTAVYTREVQGRMRVFNTQCWWESRLRRATPLLASENARNTHENVRGLMGSKVV